MQDEDAWQAKRERDRIYRETHREQIRVRAAQARLANRDNIRESNKRYREQHKEQVRAKDARYRTAHREQAIQYSKEYYAANRDQVRTQIQEWEKRNAGKRRPQIAAHHRRQREELRDSLFALLGRTCGRCGFSDERALCIDHINGGGSKERKEAKSVEVYYRAILASGGKEYQILCCNCNAIKRIENGEHSKPQPLPEPLSRAG